ncbi:MAG: hypothetical protein IPJ25_02235 [Rhodocyclaceae bacterium]|nr:hypothetical protein [Rhodocyclaceae bacterium]
MIKAGGILAIIAGLLGLAAGVVTLVMGGLGAAFSSSGADMAVGMGWGGILFSLLVVVYGAISFAKPRAGAVGLVLSAIAGAVLGGLLVAAVMVLALVAAVIVWLGRNKTAAADIPVASKQWRGMAVAAMIPILAAVLVGGKVFGSKDGVAASDAQLAYVGQTAHADHFDVTVRAVHFVQTLGEGMGQEVAPPGTLFAVFQVMVRCTDNKSRSYMPGDLLVELDGKPLKFDRSEIIIGLDSPIDSINPMTEKAGYVVFKIPAAAAKLPLRWMPEHGNSKVQFAFNVQAPVAAPSTSAVPSPAAPITPVDSAIPASAATNLAGRYVDANGSSLELRPSANGQWEFTLGVVSANGNTGDAEGVLAGNGNALSYRNTELDCLLTFRTNNNSVEVAQAGACGFGMNVIADGTYKKQMSR